MCSVAFVIPSNLNVRISPTLCEQCYYSFNLDIGLFKHQLKFYFIFCDKLLVDIGMKKN